MFYKFLLGKKTKTITQWTMIFLVVSLLVLSLHKCTGVSQYKIWDFIDVVQRHLVRKKSSIPYELNDYIIKTPELLDRRIKRDVDFAIESYDRGVKKSYKPRMKNQDILREIEKSKYTDIQRIIIKDAVYYECSDGTMDIHAIWYDSKECEY